MTGPFASALAYRARGWSGTLPLPVGQKGPPPAGFTGYDGQWPTDAQVAGWMAGDHNLALRLPPVVIGLDVDAYGDKPGASTLAELIGRWGPLPPTWTTTSREDGVSGIGLYRVPPEVQDWPTEAGPGIEIIRHAHRYAVVPPSVHPEGRPYRWLRPDGSVADGELPGLGDLPELPAAWLAGLTGHGAVGEHVKPGSRAEQRERGKLAHAWLKALPKGEPCRYVGELAVDLYAAARREDGSAYNHTLSTVLAVLRAGETGHPGVLAVLDRGRAMYVETVATDRGGAKVAEAEYVRLTVGGVVKILEQPNDRAGEGCDCQGFTMAGVTDGRLAAAATTVTPKALRFYTPLELVSLTLPAPDWLIPGYLAVSAITEIDGKIKAAGKTTLSLHMVKAVLDGSPFLGWPTRKARVLYVTEQQRQSFTDALRRASLADRGDELRILFREDLRGIKWPDVLAQVQEEAVSGNRDLVVIDTIGKLAGIVSENDAGEWSAAMNPVQDLAASGRAVLLDRHDRKSGGEVGESGRGSSQASGDVDIILAIRRPEGNQPTSRRVLESLSRYPDTPEKIVVELTGAGYILLGEDEAVASSDARDLLLSALGREFRQHDEGASQADLAELGGTHSPQVKRWAILKALDALVIEGLVTVTGKARSRTNPLRYWPSGVVVVTPTNRVTTTHAEALIRNGHAERQEQLFAEILRTTGGELLPESSA